MERGTSLFYFFEKPRLSMMLLKAIDRFFAERLNFTKRFNYWIWDDLTTYRNSEIDWAIVENQKKIDIVYSIELEKTNIGENLLSFEIVYDVDLKGLTEKVEVIVYEIDFEPAFLQSSKVSREVVDYAYDLTKKLFLAVDADFCVGAALETYLSFEETCEHFILKYTKAGPQYLISALEEKREIIDSDSPLSPNQGYAKGSTIIHEKASKYFTLE